ncbi:MAG: hypothetical protein ABEL76_16715, partial [Bradymonadaceae bacterium]
VAEAAKTGGGLLAGGLGLDGVTGGGLDAIPGVVSFGHLLSGLERLFEDSLHAQPLEELAGAQTGGYLNRMIGGLSAEGDVLRVSDLPSSREALLEAKGVGRVTADETEEKVKEMLGEWPEGVEADEDEVELGREASEKVAEGLEELDALLG